MSAHNSRPGRTPSTRRRLFLLVTLLIPLLFFPLLELGLRWGGYGTDLGLFVTEERGGRSYRIMNPDVKGRYFSRVDFTPTTSHDLFAAAREPGTFRIFFLGGSTTVGYPYGSVGSFSTFLRDRLETVFPGRTFEVVNLGMTATNSFTVLDMAGDLTDEGPDLIVVYDGHNEFYGALGLASRESAGRSRTLTRLYLALIRYRTVQLLRSVMSAVADGGSMADGETQGGTMMKRLAAGQFVPPDDPLYEATAEAFRANLEDLVALCRSRGIPLILTTQASNLRHQTPFVSLHRRGITAAESTGVAARVREAESVPPGSEPAITALRQAHMADSNHAGNAFLYAGTLDAGGYCTDALDRYRHARDMDALRFRTDSFFNDIIRRRAGFGVSVVDAESVLARHSPDGIIGSELILEHLHPAARGYFLLAAAYADAMRRMDLVAPAAGWTLLTPAEEDLLWRSRRMTDIDEAAARRRTELLTSGWPFRPASVPPPPPDPRDPAALIVEDLVRGRSTWEQAHVAAADLALASGDTLAAEREYLVLINQLPQNVSAYLLLGRLRTARGDLQEARTVLLRSLRYEESAMAHRLLGGIDLQRGAPDSASIFLERAFILAGPLRERAEVGYLLAVALSRTGGRERALKILNSVLALAPDFAPAVSLKRRLEAPSQ